MESIQNKNIIFVKNEMELHVNEMNIEEKTLGTLEQKPSDWFNGHNEHAL
jgi:hypothetical protein